MHVFRLYFLFLFLFPVTVFHALNAQSRLYSCAKLTTAAPETDGILNDVAWQNSPWAGDFTQRDPYEGKPPSQSTQFSILYDDNNLYVAIRAHDSVPSGIVKRLSRHDQYDGDWVAVELDSYNDKQTGFAFGVTASGVKFDVMLINDVGGDDTWDPVWLVKTNTDESGWTAEMKIPLSQLRFSKNALHSWGLQVIRYIYRMQEYSDWQPIPRDSPGWVSRFGEMQGINELRPHRDIELLPYLVSKSVYSEKEEGNPFRKGWDDRPTAGMDGKISLSNDFTLNITINPDFGQVEADPSVMNLTAFESYFTEKRPFFVEGKNIFDFRLTGSDDPRNQLFYSRRIGSAPHYYLSPDSGEYVKNPSETSILGAFKISGKTHKGLSVGVLGSLTQNEKGIVDFAGNRTKVSVEPLSSYFVGRLKQDFHKGNTQLGGIFTATNRYTDEALFDFLPVSAYTGGLDFLQYWKNRTYYLSLKSVFTSVSGNEAALIRLQTSSAHYFQRPDQDYAKLDPRRTNLMGQGGTVEFGKAGQGHWMYKTWLTWRSPGLDFNNLGYMQQSDEIQQLAWLGYRYYKPFSIFRYISANLNQWTGWDFGGESTYKGLNTSVYTKFKNYWSLQLSYNLDGQSLSHAELRGGPSLLIPGGQQIAASLMTDDRKKVSFKLGNTFYSSPGETYRNNTLSAGIFIKPANSISLSLEPDFIRTHNQLQYVGTYSISSNEVRYIMASLDQTIFRLSVRANFTLTPDLSLQFYGQPFLYAGKYNDFKHIINPRATRFSDRFHQFGTDEITEYMDLEDWKYYLVDENHDSQADYGFYSPSLNFLQFRSNMVIRWEYKPGSTFYLVWSQGRTGVGNDSNFDLPGYTEKLFQIRPENVFLLKLSYIFIF